VAHGAGGVGDGGIGPKEAGLIHCQHLPSSTTSLALRAFLPFPMPTTVPTLLVLLFAMPVLGRRGVLRSRLLVDALTAHLWQKNASHMREDLPRSARPGAAASARPCVICPTPGWHGQCVLGRKSHAMHRLGVSNKSTHFGAAAEATEAQGPREPIGHIEARRQAHEHNQRQKHRKP
jgi:hypothetical protein